MSTTKKIKKTKIGHYSDKLNLDHYMVILDLWNDIERPDKEIPHEGYIIFLEISLIKLIIKSRLRTCNIYKVSNNHSHCLVNHRIYEIDNLIKLMIDIECIISENLE